jgi:DNA repair exonuclease SbcCD ATPase subunit
MARLVHSYAEDFGCLRIASLPLLNQGMTLILGDNQDTRAAVNNGAGKTTLAKTICWGYFGETIDRDKFDEVIRWGAKRAYVRQVFEHDGALWIVRRERTKGSPKLSLHRAKTRKFNIDFEAIEQEEWQGSPAEVQAKIEELLGKDFRAFCNTQFFGQGDIGRFFSSTDSVQKETIHRVLRSDIFRRAEKYLREKVMKGFRQVVTDLEAELRSVRDKRGEYDLGRAQASFDEWDKYRTDRVESLLEEIKAIRENTIAKRQELVNEKTQLEERKLAIQTRLVEFAAGDPADDLKSLVARMEELSAETRKLAEQIGSAQTSVLQLRERIESLNRDVCPFCSTPLTAKEPTNLKERLNKQLENMQTRKFRLEELQGEKLVEERDAMIRQRVLKADIEKRGLLQAKLASVTQEIAAIDRGLNDETKRAGTEAARALKQLEEMSEMENPHAERLATIKARLQELDAEESKLESELKVAETELALRDFWLNAFGSQGIPSLLLDSVMPFLTERSNVHLETLTDGDITVEITNQRELKKRGAKREEIVITCNIEGVPNAKPSDGQRKKLEIASNMALMDLAVARDGESDFLMMDDVLDGLDSEGEARVLALLEGLRAKRSSIFVATHESGFEEAFEKALMVTKKNQSSTVTEVR